MEAPPEVPPPKPEELAPEPDVSESDVLVPEPPRPAPDVPEPPRPEPEPELPPRPLPEVPLPEPPPLPDEPPEPEEPPPAPLPAPAPAPAPPAPPASAPTAHGTAQAARVMIAAARAKMVLVGFDMVHPLEKGRFDARVGRCGLGSTAPVW